MHTTTKPTMPAAVTAISDIVHDQLEREAYAEVILGEDAPTTGDCADCGASHVFDTRADAKEWQADHGDLGHRVEITSL